MTRLITTALPSELRVRLDECGVEGLDLAQALNGTLVTVPTYELDKVTAALTSTGDRVSSRLEFCQVIEVPRDR